MHNPCSRLLSQPLDLRILLLELNVKLVRFGSVMFCGTFVLGEEPFRFRSKLLGKKADKPSTQFNGGGGTHSQYILLLRLKLKLSINPRLLVQSKIGHIRLFSLRKMRNRLNVSFLYPSAGQPKHFSVRSLRQKRTSRLLTVFSTSLK